MTTVKTRPPSFPEVPFDTLTSFAPAKVWQVLCGDEGHWRVGVYSPSASRLADIEELERHDCPEFFLLISGRVNLLISVDGELRELALEPGRPALVRSPHSGYCPDGPHTGVALVVERDSFDTEYRPKSEW